MCGIVIFKLAAAQHNHGHRASATDTRVTVEFPPAMKEHTLANMRDHLLAIAQIQEAMADGQYDKAAQIA